jgi:hypothetical protein
MNLFPELRSYLNISEHIHFHSNACDGAEFFCGVIDKLCCVSFGAVAKQEQKLTFFSAHRVKLRCFALVKRRKREFAFGKVYYYRYVYIAAYIIAVYACKQSAEGRFFCEKRRGIAEFERCRA